MKDYNPTINNKKKKTISIPSNPTSNLPKYQHPNFVIVSVPDWLPVVVLKLPHWPPNPPLKRCWGEGPAEPEVCRGFFGGCAVVVKEKRYKNAQVHLLSFFCVVDEIWWYDPKSGWFCFEIMGEKPFFWDLRGGGNVFTKVLKPECPLILITGPPSTWVPGDHPLAYRES